MKCWVVSVLLRYLGTAQALRLVRQMKVTLAEQAWHSEHRH